MKSALTLLVGIVSAGGFLAEGPGSLTETPASGEPQSARSFGRTPGLWLHGDSQGWPLYHAAASALTIAAVTLSFRRYRRQVRRDKKVPRAAAAEMSPAATDTSSRLVPTVDETGCGRHYPDFDSDSEEEEDVELHACRRFGKIRSLPTFQRSFPDRAAGWTPEPLKSSAGDLRRCCKFDPLSEMSVVSEAAAPSLLELGCLFNTLRNEVEEVDVHFIQAATDELNVRYKVGLNPADAQRIYNMLSKHGKEEISRENFMQTLRDLLSAVVGSKKHLSFRQLRVVMATAFERFDNDGDGHICGDEFACALRSYDIRLGPSETMVLFRLLSPDEKDALAREDLTEPASFTDRCQVALEGAQEKAVEATGFSSAAKVLGTEEVRGPDCWIQRIQGAISGRDGPEILAGAFDLATTSAAACLVLMHAHAHPHETGHVCLACQWLEQLRSAADSISASVQDVVDSGGLLPLLISSFLGALKSLAANDLVALDQNEALLYARNFHHKDCSVSLFHRLLSCGGCRWGEVSAGDTLSSPQELRVMIRGRAVRKSPDSVQEELEPGAVLQSSQEDQVIATEAVTFVAWDKQKLYQFIHDAQDLQLVKLVDEMMRDASMGADHRSVDASTKAAEASGGWTSLLSPVSSAFWEHAKRKGLVNWVHLWEGIRHILEKDASMWEKTDKCRSLVFDSASNCWESASAVADLFGAASVLTGWSQTQELSPDDMLQLAPLMVLSALVAFRAAPQSDKEWAFRPLAEFRESSCDSWPDGDGFAASATL